MTTKYCIGLLLSRFAMPLSISENQKAVKRLNSEKQKCLSFAANPWPGTSENRPDAAGFEGYLYYFSSARPAWTFAALRARAALARKRSIWPLGRVTQISPIHSSLT